MNLDDNKLMLLASVCKSPMATRQLMSSGLPAMLAQAVCEFCNQQMLLLDTAAAGNLMDSEVCTGSRDFLDAGILGKQIFWKLMPIKYLM